MTQEIRAANTREEYEVSQKMNDLLTTLNEIDQEARTLPADDVTDRKYQLDDKKKFLAGQLDMLTRDKRKVLAKMDYFNTRNNAQAVLGSYGTAEEKTKFNNLLQSERQILAGDATAVIESLTAEIRKIINPIYFRTPDYLISIYHYYAALDEYPEPSAAASLKEKGERSIANSNYEELRYIINRLHALLPPKEQIKANIKGTGIS
jgi:molecular chaperone DnaK